MTQTVPATAVLGPGKTGLTIGLRVLNLDGTTHAAFATTGVAETSVAGTYRKAGGVVVPAAGGYIVWGEAATDYAEATVESTAVNVTHHAGVAVAAADADGNVPVVLYPTQGAVTFNGQVKILANVANQGALHVANSHANGHGQYSEGGYTGQYNNGNHAGQTNTGNYAGQTNYGGAASVIGAASQEIANALKLAPSAGTPAVGSVYDLLGDAAIDPQAVRDAMLLAPTPPGTAAAGSVDALLGDGLEALKASLLAGLSGASVTVVSAVSGGTVTVHAADTWRFTVASEALEALGLADYEVLGLVVKRDARQTDNQALLYVRSDTGLARIDGAAPSSAANGALTAGVGSFSAVVHVAETAGVGPGSYTWWLKGIDTTPTPDEAVTLATGRFVVLAAGLQAVV